MTEGWGKFLLAAAIVVCFVSSALAQGASGSSSISGIVVDTAGGAIPGASVVIASNATGTKFEAMTNDTGAFAVPALPVGVYTVTVSLAGFKTALVTDVRVQLGIPTTVKATLEVGELRETVTVTGASAELINTQTATVSATLNMDQIAQIPMPTREVLNAVTFLVGVNQTGVARGEATVNGLPESFLNITLDGVSNQDTFNKSTDGFFAPVRPRQDAVEAVTVTSAAGGAEVGGHGAISINFVTRQGSNRFSGSVYEYFRHPSLNTNYWFNKRDGNPKNDVVLHQFGIRQGGPVVIPGLYDGRGKLFFFVHDEELRLPNDVSRVRTVLHPRALEGWYRYNVTVGGQQVVREVNVLDLARANNQLATTDPTVMRLLSNIQAATAKTGVVSATTDPLTNSYSWLTPAKQVEHQPAIRIDYNLGQRHRLTGTFNKLWQDRNPDQLNDFDQRFPDTPNYGHTVARRPQRSITLRSTLASTIVSEFRFGISRGERIFFGQADSGGGVQSFADQDGRAISFGLSLTNWHTRNTLSGRSAYQYTFDETLTWNTGKHSFTFGGGAFLGRAWDDSQQVVPSIGLGLSTANDPAAGIFTSGNFQGASNTQLGNARQLYAILTGRVSSVGGQATLDAATNQYSFLGRRRRHGKLNNYSTFIQDSWRVTPGVTVNAGLRWDVQTPFSPLNDTMSVAYLEDVCGVSGLGDGGLYSACQFFTPSTGRGKAPVFNQFARGNGGYNTDWNNVAPNIGIAWRPRIERGWLRTLLGDPEQATIRGGYSVAYERQGFGVFTGVFGPNPGSTLNLSRDAGTGLVPAGESWPVLLREPQRLYPAAFPETATFPIAPRANRADDIQAFHPDIKIASARQWTIGFQRAISRDMAVEARYVGTRGVNQWSNLNYNEINILENGFYDEFRLAMANFAANNASGIAGRAGSFAYFGPGTGTSPLPIYLAYINARRDATNAAAYTGTTWTNTGLTGDMGRTNPQPFSSAGDLDNDANRRANALAAGMPANFFVVNPHIDDVQVRDSGAYSDYHALQIEVRRRLSRGFILNGSYQYAIEGSSSFHGFHYGRVMTPVANVRHAIKSQWDWTVPVGRGRRFGANLDPVLDSLLGGWQFSGAARIQARMMDFGGVRLVGMTKDDVQKMYKFDIRVNPANGRMTPYMMPDDVILNTQRAFSTSAATATGYSDLGVPEGRYFAPANSASCITIRTGDCAPETLLIRAPFFTRIDVGITKRFPVIGRTNAELRFDLLNLFDNINFNPVANPGSGGTIFQVGSAYRDPNNNFDPGGRLGQFSLRLNW